MKIYHLSSAPFSGGAARAGFRLHEGLQSDPQIESLWLNAGEGASGKNTVTLPAPTRSSSILKRLKRRKWANIVKKEFAPTTPPASNPIGWGSPEILASLPTPDIWNLHWVSWLLDWETMLPWMAERAPIVWTLHDLNPLSGIWHYDAPKREQSASRMQYEEAATQLKARALKAISPDRITFAGPSKWMVECCRKSPVTKNFPVQHIPYGIDHTSFTPRGAMAFREMFEISETAFIIGLIADQIGDPRKGIDALQKAFSKFRDRGKQFHIVSVGNGAFDPGLIPHTHLGSIQNDQLLASFYSACDLFVCPSIQDNLPNTVLESLSCDTPVLAYNVGGFPDMIENARTGILLSPVGDADAIVDAAIQFKSQPNISGCRRSIENRFTLGIQNAAYKNLYQSMLAKTAS